MLRSAYITKKLYVSPVVSFETMEDDERMLMAGSVLGSGSGTGSNEESDWNVDEAKKGSIFNAEEPDGNDFVFSIDGM